MYMYMYVPTDLNPPAILCEPEIPRCAGGLLWASARARVRLEMFPGIGPSESCQWAFHGSESHIVLGTPSSS